MPVTDIHTRTRVPAFLRRYAAAFRSPWGIFSAVTIVSLTLLAFLAPWIFPGGYDEQSRNSFLTPSLEHPFGTDDLGRDIFVRAIFGLRADLSIVYLSVPIAFVLGTMLGLLGVVSKALGNAAMRLVDIVLGFPSLILALTITTILGNGFRSLLIAIIIAGVPGTARIARSAMLEQQQREYVIAARTLGIGKWRILARHILPNIVDPLIAQAAVFVVAAIFIESGMSIIGIGLQPPTPSLGVLLNAGMQFIMRSPTFIVGPLLILLLISLAFSKLADALNATVIRK